MSYLVLARKWRPQSFDDIAGQGHISRTLQNAIRTNRIAHAYLFTGVRGVGKTTAARILAKALNCERGPTPEPCNQCSHCEEITNGNSIDVLEIDGASNRGIDEIRQIIENVRYQPAKCRFKIYIIDEVHQVTKDAFNALLDAGGAAALCKVYPRHHRAPSSSRNHPVALSTFRFPSHFVKRHRRAIGGYSQQGRTEDHEWSFGSSGSRGGRQHA